jgi:hypothetical protein
MPIDRALAVLIAGAALAQIASVSLSTQERHDLSRPVPLIVEADSFPTFDRVLLLEQRQRPRRTSALETSTAMAVWTSCWPKAGIGRSSIGC